MNKSSYATYADMPLIPYRIVEHLLTNEKAEIIWKLLKYNENDAYAKPNLTYEEKVALIYKGNDQQEKYSVFFDYMMDDSIVTEKTFLRIYPSEVYPNTRVTGLCNVSFEVFTHSKINHLSNYQTRVDIIVQKLIEILNGADIGGVGVLFFDNQSSRYNKIATLGSKPFKGKLLIMSVNMG